LEGSLLEFLAHLFDMVVVLLAKKPIADEVHAQTRTASPALMLTGWGSVKATYAP